MSEKPEMSPELLLIAQAVDEMGANTGEWKDEDNREKWIEQGVNMMDFGIPVAEVIEILKNLYYALCDEFGL